MTVANTNLLQQRVDNRDALPGNVDQQNPATVMAKTVKELFGDRMVLTKNVNAGAMQSYEGAPHTTTSIPYAINGTAVVINQKMAFWISSFEDPVKAALGTAFHKTQRIIIKSVEIVGGDVTVIPERASGKTIARKEKTRTIQFTRHGNDFLMPLNLFLLPEVAKEHVNDYCTGQRLKIQRALVSMGYAAMFREGTPIERALMRASALTTILNPRDKACAADKMYAESIFGAFSKHRFALENVMTLVAAGNVYTPSSTKRNPIKMMIVPAGFTEFERTKPDRMYHYISGADPTGKKVKIPLEEGVFYDPVTGLRIMRHVPVADFKQGTGASQVETNEMQSIQTIAFYYVEKAAGVDATLINRNNDTNYMDCIVTNFETSNWETLPNLTDIANNINVAERKQIFPTTRDYYVWGLRVQMSIMMDSAILITDPGPETGELCVQWPTTFIGQSPGTESARGKFRCYMEAYLKKPENVLLLNNIRCSGIVSGGGCRVNVSGTKYNEQEHDILVFSTKTEPGSKDLFDDPDFIAQLEHYGLDDEFLGKNSEGMRTLPTRFYQGTTRHVQFNQIRTRNNGHLGILDHPGNGMFIYMKFVSGGGFRCGCY